MEKRYKKYKLNDDVTIQVLSVSEQLMTAKFWFSGKGFDGTHHHFNPEINVVTAGEFEATRGSEKFRVHAGQMVAVAPDVEHNMECLSPTGEMISTWTPPRKDILDNYTELAQ